MTNIEESVETIIPVFVPGENGKVSDITLGKATLSQDKIEIDLKGTVFSVAMQRSILRSIEEGLIVGMTFVLLDPNNEDLNVKDDDDNLTADRS